MDEVEATIARIIEKGAAVGVGAVAIWYGQGLTRSGWLASLLDERHQPIPHTTIQSHQPTLLGAVTSLYEMVQEQRRKEAGRGRG